MIWVKGEGIDRRRAVVAIAGGMAGTMAGGMAARPAIARDTLSAYPGGAIYRYRWQLLQLALSHADGGLHRSLVAPVDEIAMTQPRAERLVQAGEVDVVCFGVNAERLRGLRPIRIDIMKGMVGLRYMLIRGEDQQRIARLSDADYLQTLRFGLQAQWADVLVMQSNGLHVALVSRPERLVQLLSARRYDALPRGANEVLIELAAHSGNRPPLAIEASRAFYFPYPIYFWVRQDNEPLARAIEQGLRRVERSGEMRRLFLASHERELAFVRRSRPRLLRLSAQALPQPLEQPDVSWWWPFG